MDDMYEIPVRGANKFPAAINCPVSNAKNAMNIGEYTPEQLNIGAIGGSGIFIFLIMGIFIMFAAPDVWQRLFAANSIKTVRKASYIYALLLIIFGAALTIVGIAARNNFPNIDSSEALFYGFFQLIPGPLLGLAIIVLLATIMSSIDTQLFVLSSSIAKDFFYRRKEISEEQMAKIIRMALVPLAIVSMFVAIFVSDILLVIFGIISITLIVSPAIIASLLWKLKNNAVFLSMIGGVLALLILIFTGTFTLETSIATLPSAIVFLIIGQIIFKKRTKS